MSVRLAELTWQDARAAAEAGVLVILPTGATEAHGPHLPLDADTHQAETVAVAVAERTGALVAPSIPYGYSSTFNKFAGTLSLTNETYQQVVLEVGIALVRSGFRRILILNGNRPNGTANDAAARRLVDAVAGAVDTVTVVSYWEPGAAEIHRLRTSPVGGMGHACEFETSFQLAVRPELVHMERLEGVPQPLIGWDLVAPEAAARTYGPWPDPAAGHPAIFGAPGSGSAEAGERFLGAAVDALVELVANISPSYERRLT
jgi:creatinine amidohydrolase